MQEGWGCRGGPCRCHERICFLCSAAAPSEAVFGHARQQATCTGLLLFGSQSLVTLVWHYHGRRRHRCCHQRHCSTAALRSTWSSFAAPYGHCPLPAHPAPVSCAPCLRGDGGVLSASSLGRVEVSEGSTVDNNWAGNRGGFVCVVEMLNTVSGVRVAHLGMRERPSHPPSAIAEMSYSLHVPPPGRPHDVHHQGVPPSSGSKR